MKKLFLILLVCSISEMFAQTERFQKTMESYISKLDTASNSATYKSLANGFERVATAEKNQWLPYYYSAYCYALEALLQRDPSNLDMIADKCEVMLKIADSLSQKNSEIMCLMSMVNSARIMVDPQNRGMKYGILASQNLMAAKNLDPTNPRPYLLEAQSKIYTPEQWGGGKVAAKKALDEGKVKLESFTPASSLHPSWGKKLVEMIESQLK